MNGRDNQEEKQEEIISGQDEKSQPKEERGQNEVIDTNETRGVTFGV